MKDESIEIYARFQALENKLAKMITDTGNEDMMNTFLDWQETRTKLNEITFGTLENMLNNPNGVAE